MATEVRIIGLKEVGPADNPGVHLHLQVGNAKKVLLIDRERPGEKEQEKIWRAGLYLRHLRERGYIEGDENDWPWI